MTLDQFRQALLQALGRHFPQSGVTMTKSRGIVLTCRAELDADTFVAVYFNALTGKTSYALIHYDQRVAGYDNYRVVAIILWERLTSTCPVLNLHQEMR